MNLPVDTRLLNISKLCRHHWTSTYSGDFDMFSQNHQFCNFFCPHKLLICLRLPTINSIFLQTSTHPADLIVLKELGEEVDKLGYTRFPVVGTVNLHGQHQKSQEANDQIGRFHFV